MYIIQFLHLHIAYILDTLCTLRTTEQCCQVSHRELNNSVKDLFYGIRHRMKRVWEVIFTLPWGRFFPEISRHIILHRPKSVTSQLAIYSPEKIAPHPSSLWSYFPSALRTTTAHSFRKLSPKSKIQM